MAVSLASVAEGTTAAGPPEFAGVLSRIRESPDYPAAAAQALCQTLGDAQSYAGFKARCDAAYLDELGPQWLVPAGQGRDYGLG